MVDEERKQQIAKVLERENLKMFGPPTDAYKQYFNSLKPLNHSNYLSPNAHVATHYDVEGVAMTASLTRGYFEVKNMPLTIDDIVLASHPKTGTTWVQEIMYLILHDCDLEKAKSAPIDVRVPYLEWPECGYRVMHDSPSPRFVKTHQQHHLLPKGNCDRKYKIVYTTRNPKDTAVSMYHFYKLIKPMLFTGDVKDAVNLFLNANTIFGPFDKHALGYWNRQKDGNILVIKYEDLHKDAANEVRRIAHFLGKLQTEEQVEFIVNATSFQKMAANPQANHAQWETKDIAEGKFMRKGKIGDWKNHFDDEMNKKFDAWIDKHFSGTDLTYEYE